jgi:hypothetical protein
MRVTGQTFMIVVPSRSVADAIVGILFDRQETFSATPGQFGTWHLTVSPVGVEIIAEHFGDVLAYTPRTAQ